MSADTVEPCEKCRPLFDYSMRMRAQAIREAVEAERAKVLTNVCDTCETRAWLSAEVEGQRNLALVNNDAAVALFDKHVAARDECAQITRQLAEAKAEVIGCEAQLRGFELALGGGVLGDTLTIMEGWPFARALHEAVRLYAQLARYKRVVEAARAWAVCRENDRAFLNSFSEADAVDRLHSKEASKLIAAHHRAIAKLDAALAECREGEPTP